MSRDRSVAQAGRRKVVVITGASSGIGLATALAFAREGAALALAARDGPALERAAAECRRLGGSAMATPTDVTDAAAVEALAQAAEAAFGRIDVWINNAGVTIFGRFEDTQPEAFRRVIETNFFGCVHGARAILPRFRRQGRGVMINTSSMVGIVGQPFASAYSASKFAIRGFSEVLRQELADMPHIHVCTLLPAVIDTPVYQHAGNVSGRAIRPVDPIYPVEAAARAMVRLAARPRRELAVGRAAVVVGLQKRLAPGLTEKAAGRVAAALEFGGPAPDTPGNLFAPAEAALQGGWRAREGRTALAIASLVGVASMTALALRGRRG